MKKTTIIETFDEECRLITKETVIEEDTYSPYYPFYNSRPGYSFYPYVTYYQKGGVVW